MSSSSIYKPRFYAFLHRAGVHKGMLPETLQILIEKYEKAKNALTGDNTMQDKLLPVLVYTDAIIAAQIFQLYKEHMETENVDKVKLMALKAKALKLKWKMKNF